MDINVFRGLMSAVLLLAFIGVVVWAYSKNQKKSFDEAANLPFADETQNAEPNQDASSSLENKKHV